jgi:hypothetical protein
MTGRKKRGMLNSTNIQAQPWKFSSPGLEVSYYMWAWSLSTVEGLGFRICMLLNWRCSAISFHKQDVEGLYTTSHSCTMNSWGMSDLLWEKCWCGKWNIFSKSLPFLRHLKIESWPEIMYTLKAMSWCPQTPPSQILKFIRVSMFSWDHSRHIMQIVELVILATGGQILYIGVVLLLYTAVGFSPGGSSPYTSTHSKYKYTATEAWGIQWLHKKYRYHLLVMYSNEV